MWGFGLYSATVAYGSVAVFCERDVETSGSIIRGELLYHLGYCQNQNKRLAAWSCSRVQCFIHGNLIDIEAAVSRLLLPSNSNRPSHCEGQETTNDLSDLLSVCHWIQPSSILCCMMYFLLLNSEYSFACLSTSIRQFVRCDLHLRSAASLLQNRARSLGVRKAIYSNDRSLVVVHCNGLHVRARLYKLLYPTQLFAWSWLNASSTDVIEQAASVSGILLFQKG